MNGNKSILKVGVDDFRMAPEFSSLAAAYGVNVQGVVEAIYQPFYDTLQYAAAGQNQLRFFQQQVGGAVTLQQTNMQLAGQISAPQQFLATQICVSFQGGVLPGVGGDAVGYANDVNAFVNNGSLRFNIGNKNFLTEAPLGVLPSSWVLEIDATTTEAASTVTSANSRGVLYDITPANIPFGQNFDVLMEWQNVVALPSGNPGTVRTHLNGYLYRSAQ